MTGSEMELEKDPGYPQLSGEDLVHEQRSAISALWAGSRLLMAAGTMMLGTVVFGFFYLRALNQDGLWRLHGQRASPLLGALIMALVVGSAVINWAATRRLKSGLMIDWQVLAGSVTLAAALAAGFQIWQLTRLGWLPGSSGYASTFIGWAGVNIAFLVGGFYWIETLLMRSVRIARDFADDDGLGGSKAQAAKRFRASYDGFGLFWNFYAVVSIVFWLLFYYV
ncbi:MAG: hypothetical protein ACYDH5_11480 [Acidimicrobiales bacterium]